MLGKKGFPWTFAIPLEIVGSSIQLPPRDLRTSQTSAFSQQMSFEEETPTTSFRRGWNPILWMMRHAGCPSWHEDPSLWCGAAGLRPCWAPCCFSDWSVSLGSQFVPVKPFSYLLRAPRVAKVEAQRQVIQTHNTYRESFNDCVSPETTVSW